MKTIIVPLRGYLNGRIKKFWSLTNFAKTRRFNISNQDDIGDNVIALDVVKRKLLYAKKNANTPSCLIIDLKDLDSCTLTRQYNSIGAGELSKKKLSEFLKSISLNLHFKNSPRIVSLPLFEAEHDVQGDREVIEAKAERWGNIVSLLFRLPAVEMA